MTAETYDFSDFGSPEDLQGYDTPAEGQYHVVVNDVDQSREKVNAVKVECSILAGTVPKQEGKTWWETFWDPNPDNKDGGKFARKRIASFALATGLMTPRQLGQAVAIDWEQAKGRQFVCKVGIRESSKDGRTYRNAEIERTEMHAVNDPKVSEVPKNGTALAMLGNTVSTPAEQVQPQPQQQQPQQQAAPPAAAPEAPASPQAASGKAAAKDWSDF